jgi:hypothetical protein
LIIFALENHIGLVNVGQIALINVITIALPSVLELQIDRAGVRNRLEGLILQVCYGDGDMIEDADVSFETILL